MDKLSLSTRGSKGQNGYMPKHAADRTQNREIRAKFGMFLTKRFVKTMKGVEKPERDQNLEGKRKIHQKTLEQDSPIRPPWPITAGVPGSQIN